MGKALNKIEDMLCDELEKIAEQGELTAGSLDTVDKLTHSLKSIETILAMKDSGYSNDVRPRYTSHYSDNGGRWSRMYSRDEEQGRMVERLRDMLDETSSDKARTALKNCISQMEG